jgi:hypothetical protein
MNYSSNISLRNPHGVVFSLFSSSNIFNIDNAIDCSILRSFNLGRNGVGEIRANVFFSPPESKNKKFV